MRTKLSKEKNENKDKISEMWRDFTKLQKIIKVDKLSEVMDKKEQLARTHDDLEEQTKIMDEEITELQTKLKESMEDKSRMLEDHISDEKEEFEAKTKKKIEMEQSLDE